MAPSLADRTLILFDAGGTLVTLDYDRVREALAATSVQPTDDELDRAEVRARLWADEAVRARSAARELWSGYFGRLLSGVGIPASALPQVLESLWRMNQDVGLWRRPAPHAKSVLERLRRAGRRLAVVSNAEGRVEADLVAAGLGEFLETVVDSHLVGVAKPDPRIFEICLGRMGGRADQAVYVGDVPAFDVAGARAAGIPVILIDPHAVHAGVAGVTRIRGLAELPSLLGVG
jgi:putative hydrolase of the HAD superfamily